MSKETIPDLTRRAQLEISTLNRTHVEWKADIVPVNGGYKLDVFNSRDDSLMEKVRKLEDAFSDKKRFPVCRTPNEAFRSGIQVIQQEKAGGKLHKNLAAFKIQEDAERARKAQLKKLSRAAKDKGKVSSRADNGPLEDF